MPPTLSDPSSTDPTKAQGTSKDGQSLYETVRNMAISFRFPPGQRINEGELAKQLGVSRTPLREAMQKLVSDELLRWERNKGFFCRLLDEREIFDLYEYRKIIEQHTTRLACQRATEAELLELKLFVVKHLEKKEERDLTEQLEIDQAFHERIALLSGNKELLGALKKINQRIYFVRWIDMSMRTDTTQSGHLVVADALLNRDEQAAIDAMVLNVDRRLEQITDFIREGYGLIYTGKAPNYTGNSPS